MTTRSSRDVQQDATTFNSQKNQRDRARVYLFTDNYLPMTQIGATPLMLHRSTIEKHGLRQRRRRRAANMVVTTASPNPAGSGITFVALRFSTPLVELLLERGSEKLYCPAESTPLAWNGMRLLPESRKVPTPVRV